MASADKELETLQDGHEPEMPHLQYRSGDLDTLFPGINVPDEDLLDAGHEQAVDVQDAVYQHGLKIAAQVQADMTEMGRTRRPPAMRPTPSSPVSRSRTARTEGRKVEKKLLTNQYNSLGMIHDGFITDHRRSAKARCTVSTSSEAETPESIPRAGIDTCFVHRVIYGSSFLCERST